MGQKKQKKLHSITRLAVRAILAAVVFVLLLGLFFCYISYKKSVDRSKENVQNDVDDIVRFVDDEVQEFIAAWAMSFADGFQDVDLSDSKAREEKMKELSGLADADEAYELYVIDMQGMILASIQDGYTGMDLSQETETKEALAYLFFDSSATHILEGVRLSLTGSEALIAYVDYKIKGKDAFIRWGIPEERYLDLIRGFVENQAAYRRLGNTGQLLIVDSSGTILDSYEGKRNNQSLAEGWPEYDVKSGKDIEWEEAKIYGEDVRVIVRSIGECRIIGYMPVAEIRSDAMNSVLYEMINLTVMSASLIILMILFFRKRMVRTIRRVVGGLVKITSGDLFVRIEEHDSTELATLSDGINQTVDALKEMIDKEAARIDEELAFAKKIQLSALPSDLPKRDSFSVFASIRTAKEVGGDFYNVFMVSEETLVFLIADVSGKGIPAALFMMEAKTIIEEQARQGKSPGEVFTNTNNKLCSDNEAGMFVTAWIGFLNIRTGRLTMANAGHNPFVFIHDDEASYHQYDPGLVLGMIDDFEYAEEEMQLVSGDMIYLYTDGVTEAEKSDRKLYGEERLLEALGKCLSEKEDSATEEDRPTRLCEAVGRSVYEYSMSDGGEIMQTDDITMVCLEYKGDR